MFLKVKVFIDLNKKNKKKKKTWNKVRWWKKNSMTFSNRKDYQIYDVCEAGLGNR